MIVDVKEAGRRAAQRSFARQAALREQWKTPNRGVADLAAEIYQRLEAEHAARKAAADAA